MLGFKVFDWIHPNMHVEKELAEKHNIAVAIVMAAIIIGISIVIAVAIQVRAVKNRCRLRNI